jgi:hypothetical protein
MIDKIDDLVEGNIFYLVHLLIAFYIPDIINNRFLTVYFKEKEFYIGAS